MVAEMVARGVDNQFVDLEAFVLNAVGEGEASVVIKTMEVNCRTFCNQLPIFSKLFGGKDGDACMFSVAVDMLLGIRPQLREAFADGIVPTADDAKILTEAQQRVGVCTYMPHITGCPEIVKSESQDAAYFAIEGFPAHVYVVGTTGEAAARRRCDEFYQELQTQYSPAS